MKQVIFTQNQLSYLVDSLGIRYSVLSLKINKLKSLKMENTVSVFSEELDIIDSILKLLA